MAASAPVLLALLVLLGLLAAAVAAAVAASRPGASPVTAPTREGRRVRRTRVAGVVVGAGAALVVTHQGARGVGPMLAPAAFGLCVVLAVALGETVVRAPRPAGIRTASLTPRRVAHYLPRATGAVVGVLVVLLAALLTLTTLTAGRDASSGEMRALSCATATFGSSRGPYPGSYYTGPLAGLLVAVLLVAALASHQVVRRPRGLAADEPGDDALRRRSLDVIVAAVGIAVSAPYVGVALAASGALRGLGDQQPSCAAAWMSVAGTGIGLSAPVAGVLGLVCAGRLLSRPRPLLAQPVGSAR